MLTPSIRLPFGLERWLDSWGIDLKRRFAIASAAAWDPIKIVSRLHCPLAISQPIKLGTDCSGLEAPVHSLRALGIQYQHEFSSEKAEAPAVQALVWICFAKVINSIV